MAQRRVADRVAARHEATTAQADVAPPARPITANERAFRVMIRNAMFRRVELAALRRVDQRVVALLARPARDHGADLGEHVDTAAQLFQGCLTDLLYTTGNGQVKGRMTDDSQMMPFQGSPERRCRSRWDSG